MKKMGELMKEMGFNPKSSTSAQEAFIKFLIKSAHGVDVVTPAEKKIIQNNPQKIVSLHSLTSKQGEEQLSFQFDEVTTRSPAQKTGS